MHCRPTAPPDRSPKRGKVTRLSWHGQCERRSGFGRGGLERLGYQGDLVGFNLGEDLKNPGPVGRSFRRHPNEMVRAQRRTKSSQANANGVGMDRSTVFRIAFLLLALGAVRSAPADEGDDQFAIAARHYQHARWQQAADEFRTLLSHFPDHPKAPVATFFLGEALIQQESYAESRRYFGEFLERAAEHPHSAQARFRLGEISYLMKEDEPAREALGAFRDAHPEHPLNAFAIPHLAAIALRNRDPAAARDLYSDALQRYPDGALSDHCRLGLGRALSELGDYAEAMRFFELLANQPDGTLADDARLRAAIAQYRQRRYTDAIAGLASFDSDFADSDLKIQAAYWLGLSQLGANQPEVAAQTLARAAQLAPDHELMPAIEFASGEAARLAGTLDEAITHFEHVVGDWPSCRWADDSLQVLVEVAFQQGQYDRVADLCQQFSAQHPTSRLHPLVQQYAGRALLKQERYADATASLLRAIELADDEQAPDRALDGMAVHDGLALPLDADTNVGAESLRNSSRYYLALAYLGDREFQQALDTLDQTTAGAEQIEFQLGLRAARGAALIGLDRYADAVPPLEEYLRLRPDGDDAPVCRAQLAIALAQQGKFTAAQTAHAQLSSQSRTDRVFLTTTLQLAELAFSAGERELAAEWFRTLTHDEIPNEFREQGLAGLAWTQAGSQDPRSSIATFERLLAERPDSPLATEAALAIAKSHEQLQDYPAALIAYERILERFAASPQFAAALFGAARVQEKLDQPEEAVRLLEQLVREHTGYPRLDAVLYELGWLLFELGRVDESNTTFERLANEYSQSEFWADATYRLAERAARAQQTERARELTERIVQSEANPDVLCHALYLQGQLAASDKRWADVAAPMQRVVRDFPDSPMRLSAEYWLAEASYQQQDYELAETRFGELVRGIQGRTDPWMGMIPLRLAQVLAQRGSWQEASQLAAGIAGQFRDFRQQFEVDYVLGRCLAAQGRFREAREAYQRAILSPAGGKSETAAMAQWMIGETYFHQKQYDEAIRAYHRVESLFDYPRWQAAALLQVGKCHEARQDWSRALDAYKQLLDEFSETDFAGEAAERLRAARSKVSQQARTNRGRTR